MSHTSDATHERLQPPLQRAALIDIDLDALAALLQLPAGVRISHVASTHQLHRLVVLCVTGAGPLVTNGTTLPRFQGWCRIQRDAEGVEHVRVTWPGLFTDELETGPC